ncbi:hypothetical protein K501DRAFT_285773 [Backusella circina FSU 941]|nr:hypothetical protein K501DRAFT_285773 [Backusella circina FSU 941]
MESTDKPTLPPFHTLLSQIEEPSFNKSKTIGHRRHKSDHLSAFTPFKKDESSLSPVFEKLSLQSMEKPLNTFYHPKPSPRYIHARSYSDDKHPYPSTKNNAKTTACHRRATSATSLDFILQPTDTPNPPSSHHLSSAFTSTFKATGTPPESLESSKMERKYNCTYCNKTFSRPSSLRIHTYSHTGERPFECSNPLCSRRFSVQSNLRRHMRTHRSLKVVKFTGGAAGHMKKSQLALKFLAPTPI